MSLELSLRAAATCLVGLVGGGGSLGNRGALYLSSGDGMSDV